MAPRGPNKQLRCAVARIRSRKYAGEDDRKVAGMGVFLSNTHVLTCAHVVCGALGLDRDRAEVPTGPVYVDLPLLPKSPDSLATVVSERWKVGGHDVTLLSLEDSLTDVQDPGWYSGPFYEHFFSAFGCPADREEGVWTKGTIKQRRNTDVQLQLGSEGYPITKGFSGGPVWDHEEGAVVGIVTTYERQRETGVAFMLPLDIVEGAFPSQDAVSAPSNSEKKTTELTDAELTSQLIKSGSLPASVQSIEPLRAQDPNVIRVVTSEGYPAVGLVRARPATDEDVQILETLRREVEIDTPLPVTGIIFAPECTEKARRTLEKSDIQILPINEDR